MGRPIFRKFSGKEKWLKIDGEGGEGGGGGGGPFFAPHARLTQKRERD